MKKLIVITGPTGAGKTTISIKIARKWEDIEIISADSRQIYKEMDIGTAKVKEEIRNQIPHHLINIKKPDEDFTVAEFKQLARKKIDSIQDRENIPILCGGTYFYIQAAVDGLVFPQVSPDWDFRNKKQEKSTEQLFTELQEKDPRRANDIDPNNKRRIIRALEIIHKTGKPVPPLKKEELPYSFLMFGIKVEREKLDQKIAKRVDEMIQNGLKKEAKQILQKYDKVPRETIGYQEWEEYFQDNKSEQEVVKEIKTHTQQYARKQLTWLKKDDRINWIASFQEAKNKLTKYLNK